MVSTAIWTKSELGDLPGAPAPLRPDPPPPNRSHGPEIWKWAQKEPGITRPAPPLAHFAQGADTWPPGVPPGAVPVPDLPGAAGPGGDGPETSVGM